MQAGPATPSNAQDRCLIIGAGIAGLMAAATLEAAGLQATVLEKARGVGGRMATRRIDAGTFDHGAQFFTVRDRRFAAHVATWQQQGVVAVWAQGFPAGLSDSPLPQVEVDGHPRYRGALGMTAAPKALAEGLDVRLRTRVQSIEPGDAGWVVRTETGEIFRGGRLILTPPIPQSLALLEAGNVTLPKAVRSELGGISYDPCIALLALAKAPVRIPAPGAVRFDTGIIRWIADNDQKGISGVPAITIHASPDFSRIHWEAPEEAIADQLLGRMAPWLDGPIQTWQIHRWRYSQPRTVYQERCLVVEGRPPLILAGDAFGGPRVEGAALSGLAAADALLEQV